MIDKQTFVAQIDEKSGMLFRVARSILRSTADCDDALQESVMKAWASRHMLREEKFFATWMTRILIRECRNIQRKQAKYALEADVEVQTKSEGEMSDTDLHAAVDALPEKQRLPLVLHYIEGYALKEIAAMLRLPVTTVRNRLYAARQRLRLELADESDEQRKKEAQPYEA